MQGFNMKSVAAQEHEGVYDLWVLCYYGSWQHILGNAIWQEDQGIMALLSGHGG